MASTFVRERTIALKYLLKVLLVLMDWYISYNIVCLIICLSYKRHVNKGALNWRRKCSEKLEIDVYVVVDFCLLFFLVLDL